MCSSTTAQLVSVCLSVDRFFSVPLVITLRAHFILNYLRFCHAIHMVSPVPWPSSLHSLSVTLHPGQQCGAREDAL